MKQWIGGYVSTDQLYHSWEQQISGLGAFGSQPQSLYAASYGCVLHETCMLLSDI